jgi:hypothetical protein
MRSIAGIPVILSPEAYTVKIVTKGLADKRRPNTRRPLYRRVTKKVPAAFMVRTGFIEQVIAHPDWIASMEAQFQQITDPLRLSGLLSPFSETPPFQPLAPIPPPLPIDSGLDSLRWRMHVLDWSAGLLKNGIVGGTITTGEA